MATCVIAEPEGIVALDAPEYTTDPPPSNPPAGTTIEQKSFWMSKGSLPSPRPDSEYISPTVNTCGHVPGRVSDV